MTKKMVMAMAGMKIWLTTLAAGTFLFTSAFLGAQERSDIETLKVEIEAMKPQKLAWREIGWGNCPLEAIKESREKHKPTIIWVFLGNPTDERC